MTSYGLFLFLFYHNLVSIKFMFLRIYLFLLLIGMSLSIIISYGSLYFSCISCNVFLFHLWFSLSLTPFILSWSYCLSLKMAVFIALFIVLLLSISFISPLIFIYSFLTSLGWLCSCFSSSWVSTLAGLFEIFLHFDVDTYRYKLLS
jgi:hypothetical protein